MLSAVGSARPEAGTRVVLGRGLPNRLWVAALILLAAALYVAANGGPSLMAVAALLAAAALIAAHAALSRIVRVVSVDRGDLVLGMCLFGVMRVVDRLTGPRRLHVSAACVHPARCPELAQMELRVVSEEERITWCVRGVSAAAEQVEALRDLVGRAGLRLAREQEALRGSLASGRGRRGIRYSWAAASPKRAWPLVSGILLTLLAMLADTVFDAEALRIATPVGLALGLATLVVAGRRTSSARAWLEVDPLGWAYGRQRLWGSRSARGGAAALPGRVVMFERRSLPAEYALLTRDGTPALSERELSPPEMRWLATQVVDSLDAGQRSQRAA